MLHSIITHTGSYIPEVKVRDDHFMERTFITTDGIRIDKSNADIIQKFKEITCIHERRYVPDDQTTSDIAFMAAQNALQGVDPETLDYIIVAHNLGDVRADNRQSEMIPSLAARVKHRLGIQNPYTVAFDIPFGCPGWLHGVITADYFIKSGDVHKVMVIGAETLSRMSDPHDIDSMIYADGAGAALVEATDQNAGVLSHVTRSDTFKHLNLLRIGESYNPEYPERHYFVKMHGHEIYKYALRYVPEAVKKSLDKAGFDLGDVQKVLIHQANQKMDEAILARIFKLYKVENIPADIMPITVSWLGNSSVATLPTLLDLLQREQLDGHRIHSGDILVFASVGAGMNINSMVYRVP